MEYKLYLTGLSFSFKRNYFHKNNLEYELKNLEDQKIIMKDNQDQFLDIIRNIKFEDIIDKKVFFELYSTELKVVDTNNKIVFEDKLINIVSNKVITESFNSKENVTILEECFVSDVNDLHIKTIEQDIFDISKISINKIIEHEGLFYIDKINYNFIDFIDFNIYNISNYNFFEAKILKFNQKGYKLLNIYSYIDNYYYADILINKYSNEENHLIKDNKIFFVSYISKENYLSIEDSFKNYFFNFDIKHTVENVFGLTIDKIVVIIENEFEFDLDNLNYEKIKFKNKELLYFTVKILFKEELNINKGIFINKISNIFLKTPKYSIVGFSDLLKNTFEYKYSYLTNIKYEDL